MLLACGVPPSCVQAFLLRELNAEALSRTHKAVNVAAAALTQLCVCHLAPACEMLVQRLGHLHGLSKWPYHFAALGLQVPSTPQAPPPPPPASCAKLRPLITTPRSRRGARAAAARPRGARGGGLAARLRRDAAGVGAEGPGPLPPRRRPASPPSRLGPRRSLPRPASAPPIPRDLRRRSSARSSAGSCASTVACETSRRPPPMSYRRSTRPRSSRC